MLSRLRSPARRAYRGGPNYLATFTALAAQLSAPPLPDVPRPRFWFGDKVQMPFTVDDCLDPDNGKTFYYRGEVKGALYYDLAQAVAGDEIGWRNTEWLYAVVWFGEPRYSSLPFYDVVGESVLQPWGGAK